MDPDNHKEVTVGSVEQRSQELDKYGLFPMYPTGESTSARRGIQVLSQMSRLPPRGKRLS